jgi:mono/diheme cytochrome c family protein
MTSRMLAALLAVALLIPPTEVGAADEEVEKGRALAERLCVNCHLNPGQGEKAGAAGVPSFVAVANRPAQTFDGVVAWLRSVPPMMPNHRLTREEVDALAAFIMSLRAKS